MKVGLSHFLVFIYTTSFGLCLANENDVSIVSPSIPFLLSEDDETRGAYNIIIEQVDNKLKDDFSHFFMPPARAYLSFEQSNFDCIFPVNTTTIKQNKGLIESAPLGVAKAYVYTLKAQPIIAVESQLVSLKLGVRRGFDYGGFNFSPSIQKVEVGSIEQNIKLLELGRIDAFVAYEPDAIGVIENNPQVQVHRDENFSIYTHYDKIACYNSTKNKAFIANVNNALKSMFNSSATVLNHKH